MQNFVLADLALIEANVSILTAKTALEDSLSFLENDITELASINQKNVNKLNASISALSSELEKALATAAMVMCLAYI